MKYEVGDIFYCEKQDRMGWFTGTEFVWERNVEYVHPFDGVGIA